eukprot:7389023-Heterocapsa_arctica.AAC.1
MELLATSSKGLLPNRSCLSNRLMRDRGPVIGAERPRDVEPATGRGASHNMSMWGSSAGYRG